MASVTAIVSEVFGSCAGGIVVSVEQKIEVSGFAVGGNIRR